MFEKLTIPNTLAAGPGPGNTDPRVLEQFSKAGLADPVSYTHLTLPTILLV